MATKSEKQRAESERKGLDPKKAKRQAMKLTNAEKHAAHANAHAGKKATYALDPQAAPGRPSRKSTRKGANHAKPDTNLTNREQMQKGSPTARARRAVARTVRA